MKNELVIRIIHNCIEDNINDLYKGTINIPEFIQIHQHTLNNLYKSLSQMLIEDSKNYPDRFNRIDVSRLSGAIMFYWYLSFNYLIVANKQIFDKMATNIIIEMSKNETRK